MRCCAACRCLLACLFVATPGVSRGQVDNPSVDAAVDDLVIGDWYDIDSEHGPAKEQFKGRLVKINDQWLVLHTHAVARVAVKSSALSNLPFVGQYFVGSKTQKYDVYNWVPRDTAMIAGHYQDRTNTPPVKIEEELPPTHEYCHVIVDAASKREWKGGEIVEANDEVLILADDRIPRKSVLGVRVERPVDDP